MAVEELEVDLSVLTLDEIEEIPDIMPLPTGGFTLQFNKWEEDDNLVRIYAKVASVVELKKKDLERDEEPPEEGTEVVFTYAVNNKFGLANMKSLIGPVGKHFQLSKVADALNALCDNMTMLLVMQRTFNKGKGRYYSNIKQAALVV